MCFLLFKLLGWDDRVARIPLGGDVFASSISSAAAHLFVRTSEGKLLLYDSYTLEETFSSPIVHGERLYLRQANSSGTLLATYGYHTVKIWKVSSGTCEKKIQNLPTRPRPLAMRFVGDRLLIGSDDCKIRSVDVGNFSPTLDVVADLDEPELDDHHLNAASLIAFNNDGSLVAIAYRGHPLSAWETKGPVHISHCWRTRPVLVHGDVVAACWLPKSPEILGCYVEGVVFKWNPYTDETVEAGIGAKRLSLSEDGFLCVTGNGKGLIQVIRSSDLTVVYRLMSEDTIFDITFGSIPNRFYDIRGEYATAWEPSALVRHAHGANGCASDDENGQARLCRPKFYPTIDPITALAVIPQSSYFVTGSGNGVVKLHHLQEGEIRPLHSLNGFTDIEHLCCTPDSQHLVFSDLNKKVTIASISGTSSNEAGFQFEIKATIQLRTVTNGPIMDLLVHPTSIHILVRAAASLHVISMDSFNISNSTNEGINETQRWIPHPKDPSLLIGLGATGVCVVDWELTEKCRVPYASPLGSSTDLNTTEPLYAESKVEQALVTRNSNHILLEVSHPKQPSARSTSFMLIQVGELFVSEDSPGSEVPSVTLPPAFTPHALLRPLTLVSYQGSSRLIYISSTSLVCQFEFSSGTVKTLFPLRRDWVNKESLSTCQVWSAQKSFLCPENGRVQVVKCFGISGQP